MDKLIVIVFGLVLAAFVLALAAVAIAIPLYFLWNWLMPELFGLKIVTFWQAWGLVWLTSLLFKSSASSSKELYTKT